MRFLRILPLRWPSTSCPLSSTTRKCPPFDASLAWPSRTMASSFGFGTRHAPRSPDSRCKPPAMYATGGRIPHQSARLRRAGGAAAGAGGRTELLQPGHHGGGHGDVPPGRLEIGLGDGEVTGVAPLGPEVEHPRVALIGDVL